MNWTAVEDKLLIDNRPQMSSSQLANLIGCTRNAVIGRSHRLGLEKLIRAPNRTSGERARRVNGERKIRKPPTLHIFESPRIPVTSLNIPFIELERHHCREITGHGDFNLSLSCGHPVIEGRSYCMFHAAINYTPPRSRGVQSIAA